MQAPDLLEQIEAGALDSRVPISDALRKCVMLGGRSGSEALRDWAAKELDGYGPDDDLPNYRVINCPLQMDGMQFSYQGTSQFTGMAVPYLALPEVVREKVTEKLPLPHGASDLEALQGQPEIKLGPVRGDLIVQLMNGDHPPPGRHVDRLYWAVSHGSIEAVLGQIRNSLVKLVAELHAVTPTGETPTAAAADNALNVVVSGIRNRVTVMAPQAAGDNANATVTMPSGGDGPSRSWRWWGRVGAFVAGSAAIAGAVVAVVLR